MAQSYRVCNSSLGETDQLSIEFPENEAVIAVLYASSYRFCAHRGEGHSAQRN